MRAHAAFRLSEGLIGINAQLLAGNVVAGQFAQAELVGIVADAIEAQFAAKFFKIEVIAVGESLRHIHAETGQPHQRIPRDNPFGKSGQGHGELDRRAGLGTWRKRQFLVHHRQDPAVGRIDDNGRAVHIPEGVNGCLTNNRILARWLRRPRRYRRKQTNLR